MKIYDIKKFKFELFQFLYLNHPIKNFKKTEIVSVKKIKIMLILSKSFILFYKYLSEVVGVCVFFLFTFLLIIKSQYRTSCGLSLTR
jgi:hypothetical protein